MSDTLCIWGFLILSGILFLAGLIKRRVLMKGMAFSAATGLGSLGLVSVLSGPLGLGIGFNALSAAVAVMYGIPGVVGMLLLRVITAT